LNSDLFIANGQLHAALEHFTYCRERYWLVAATKLLSKIALRGHKSAWNAV